MNTDHNQTQSNGTLPKFSGELVSSFISTQLTNISSLNELSSCIAAQKELNKKNLDLLIKKKHDRFSGFHTFIHNFDDSISRAMGQTDRIKDQVQQLKAKLDSELSELQDTIMYKNQIEKTKKELLNFMEIEKMLQRLDRIVEIQISYENSDDCQDFIKEIVRAASDITKLKYLIRKDEKYPFIVESSKRVASVTNKAIVRLDDIFEYMLSKWTEIAPVIYKKNITNDIRDDFDKSNNIKDQIIQCLWAYFLIEKTGRAEEIVRKKLISSRLKKLIEQVGLKRGEISIDPEAFSLMLDLIMEEMLIYLRPLQALINVHLTSTSIDLAVNSFWVEFASQTQVLLPNLFVPGIPTRFNLNYLRAESFTQDLTTEICISDLSANRLYDSESFEKWWKKWHLPAFFAIQQKRIVERVLKSLDNKKHKGALLDTRFVFTGVLSEIWSEKMFIHSLSHRWWKLTLQLIQSYHGFVESHIKTCQSLSADTSKTSLSSSFNFNTLPRFLSPKNNSSNFAELQSELLPSLIQIYDLNEVSLNFMHLAQTKILPVLKYGTYGNSTDTVTVTTDINSEALSHKSNKLALYSENEFDKENSPEIKQILPLTELRQKNTVKPDHDNGQDQNLTQTQNQTQTRQNSFDFDQENLEILLYKSVSHLNSILKADMSSVIDLVSAQIANTCNRLVSQVKQIPSTYRHTNRQMPTKQSDYIENIFSPLESVLKLVTVYPNSSSLLDIESASLKPAASTNTSASPSINSSTGKPGPDNSSQDQIVGMPCDVLYDLVALVIDQVCSFMLEASVDLLDNINKANASLERLRNSSSNIGAGIGGGSGSAKSKLAASLLNTDDNKIKRQLYFDVLKVEEIISLGWKTKFINPPATATISPSFSASTSTNVGTSNSTSTDRNNNITIATTMAKIKTTDEESGEENGSNSDFTIQSQPVLDSCTLTSRQNAKIILSIVNTNPDLDFALPANTLNILSETPNSNYNNCNTQTGCGKITELVAIPQVSHFDTFVQLKTLVSGFGP